MGKTKKKIILCRVCDAVAYWECPVCGSARCDECQTNDLICQHCEAYAKIPKMIKIKKGKVKKK